MKVYIVSYRGTIYGVFDSEVKAETYIKTSCDEYWPIGSDWHLTEYEVE